MKDGKGIRIRFDDTNFKREYRDDYTKEILPRHLVKEAMLEELRWFNKVVWRGVTKERTEAAHRKNANKNDVGNR